MTSSPRSRMAPGALCVGLWLDEFHARWPWSEARWSFVGARVAALTEQQHRGSAAVWREALAAARSVRGIDDLHLHPGLESIGLAPRRALFDDPPSCCRSFSRYWQHVTRGRVQARELLGRAVA